MKGWHPEFGILDKNLYKNGLFLGEIARYWLEDRRFSRMSGVQRLVAWKLRRKKVVRVGQGQQYGRHQHRKNQMGRFLWQSTDG
jgi:hypothetical protein